MQTDIDVSTCIICKNNTRDFLNLNNNCDLRICNNCFHIQTSDTCKTKYAYEKLREYKLFDLICSKIDKRINKYNCVIKILNLNDTNTNILNKLYEKYKYNVKTVSVSELFNPSFFSKHYCSKNDLTDWTLEYLQNNYGKFDIIILNSTLSFHNYPNDILNKCYKLSNENTFIFSTNYDFLNLYSHVFLFKLRNIKHIFNTNSMNRLCDKHNFVLNHKYNGMSNGMSSEIPNSLSNEMLHTDKLINIIIYEFSIKKKVDDFSSVIINGLYDEIKLELYDEQNFKSISNNLKQKYILYNDIITKYESLDYIIIILENSYSLDHFNFNSSNKYLFVILDYDNLNNHIINLKNKISYIVNLQKCLILNIKLLITFTFYE